MAELTISLRRDPQTGKHDIIIKLESDADALPHEHEQQHRQLVEKVIGKENVGKVIIEREPGSEPTSPIGEPAPQERKPQGQSG
jgi:FtsH ternary system domain X3-analog